MILELNKPIGSYMPMALVSSNCSYREVYEATDGEKKVFLTVYDNVNMPKCLQGDSIQEFDIVQSLVNEVFPKYITHGDVTVNGKRVSYMATEYFKAQPLKDFCGKLPTKDFLEILFHILIALKELLYKTEGGGHYNITTETIRVAKNEDGTYQTHIVGLEHAGKACNGSTPFDTETLNHCFRAPETMLGRFSNATDVYSLGMVISFMLQGILPYDIDESMSKTEIMKRVKQSQPNIMFSDKYRVIAEKALKKNVSERYKDVGNLGFALSMIMEVDNPNMFRCFSDENKKRKIGEGIRYGNPCVINKENKSDRQQEQLSSQDIKLNVTMTTRMGDGFRAVAGMAELKRQLKRDFVDIVSNRELAKQFSILPPNLILYGPPGTGKSYIAQRLSEETGLECCEIKPSDLASIWIHGSQKLIQQLFTTAIQKAKTNKRGCLVVIDEIDALVPKRTADDHNHRAGEVAEFLTQLNDCVEKNVYVIGTTNRLDSIDAAIIRKGRIDQVIFIGMPDEECRKELFEIELNKRPHNEEINYAELVHLTNGFTSSDISYIVKETARNAFEASLCSADKQVVKINQTMLEEVIRKTRPSVSSSEVKQYERMRDDFINNKKNDRPRIGFC